MKGLACARAAGSTRIEINALSLVEVFAELGPEERIRLGEEAIAGARAYGDRWLLGLVTGNHGLVLSQLGETQKATDLTEEAYRLCRATGDVFLTALWINNLAEAPCGPKTPARPEPSWPSRSSSPGSSATPEGSTLPR